MNVFLFSGGAGAVGAPADRAALPKAWRRYPSDVWFWRRGAWHRQTGVAEFANGVGPELGFAVETLRSAAGELGIIRTGTDGLNPAHAARKTAHTVRAALMEQAARVTGAYYDGPDPQAFAADLRVGLNLPDLPVHAPGPRPEGMPDKTVTWLPVAATGTATPRGRIRAGRLLARAMQPKPGIAPDTASDLAPAPASTPEPPLQRWIWNSRQYQAWSEDITDTTQAAMVALPHATTIHGLFEYGFGRRYFAKRRIPTVYVRCAKSRWFQNDEALEVASAIRNRLGPDIRLTTYGVSMGGYGALMFSGPLRAETALAIAPQFSIDPRDVPEETRWRGSANRIGGFIHDLGALTRPEARKIVIYDRMSKDRHQIDRLPTDESWEVLNLPFSSHQVLGFLAETGTLDVLFRGCPGKGPDLRQLWRAARARRRESMVYWRELRALAKRCHPAWAPLFHERRREVEQARKSGGAAPLPK